MTRGPKPMTAEEQKARGNPGKRSPSKKAAIAVGDSKIERPAFLKGRKAGAVWERIAGSLISANLVRSTDAVALARYCQYVVDWIEANDVVSKMKVPVYETDTNHGKMLRIHPAATIRGRLEDDLIKLEEKLGLTPADRHRLLQNMAAMPQVPPGGMFDPPEDQAPASEADANTSVIGALH